MIGARAQSPARRAALALALVLAACGEGDGLPAHEGGDAAPAAPDRLEPLRRFEAERRAAADFARIPASDIAMGPDPVALRRLDAAACAAPAGVAAAPPGPASGSGAGAACFVSALRGRDALVLLDASLHEASRAPAPASPVGVAVVAPDAVVAAGEASPEIFRYAVRGGAIERVARHVVPGVHGLTDLAAGPEGVLYALDERDGALLTLRAPDDAGSAAAAGAAPPAEVLARQPVGAGPIRVARLAHHILVNCLLDHEIVIRRVGADGVPRVDGEVRIRHDGSLWSLSAVESGEEVFLAAGGVEDHPLDRTGGFFGYVDSFVFVYRASLAAERAPAVRLAEVNVSALGVITPKALSLTRGPAGDVRVWVTGYGGDQRAELRFRPAEGGALAGPDVAVRPLPPGTAAMAPLDDDAVAYANPLLDAWILERAGAITMTPVPDPAAVAGAPQPAPAYPARSLDSRVGEALFFTKLMAPWGRSDGPVSRFTCETCHFDAYGDGRIHHTGRGDVHATTKPLLGLFNNRPHFSRALDPDLATMVNNEFRVAGAKSDHDPWFSISPSELSWLSALGVRGELDPEALRRALMTYLMELSHRPNPAVLGRARFSDVERAGAAVFRDRCERCHAARLASDDPATAVPFERWEPLVFAREGALVWGRAGYEKTGVVPYVHDRGARVPSLRRLYKKRPYFTNGAARTVRDVLERARFGPDAFFHDGAPAGLEALSPGDVEALLAFLDLL